MITYLRIRDFALLSEVEIRFRPGLNLLTGETGAGKSIVVDALGLLLGARASADGVRSGARRAVLEGLFRVDPSEGLAEVLEGLGLDPGDRSPAGGFDLVVRREVGTDGSRAFVNGSPAAVGTLREIGGRLVQVHGQHDQQALLRPSTHRQILDAFDGQGDLLAEVERLHRELNEALSRRAESATQREAGVARLDLVRHRLREIDAVGPRPQEEDELRGQRERLRHGAEIGALSAEVQERLAGDEGGSVMAGLARVHAAVRRLGVLGVDLAEAAVQLEAARAALGDLAAELRRRTGAPEDDPGRLEAIEARLSALAGLRRRFGGSLEEVCREAERLREERRVLEAVLQGPAELDQRVREAMDAYRGAALRLSAARRSAAARLQRALHKELAAVALKGSRVQVQLSRRREAGSPVEVDGEPLRFGPHGLDQVEFLLTANPGEEPRPLADIASGGELSRVMLALECTLLGARRASPAPRRLVFDEVDAGIGGRVAAAVGERLQRLAGDRQVLCVTHLPQIASRPGYHLLVEKHVERGRTVTRVRPLDEAERIEEVARMLAGSRVTAASRRHAREMVGRIR